MPLFNLRDHRDKSRRARPIDRLNEMLGEGEYVRPSDFANVPESQVSLLGDSLRTNSFAPNETTKVAVHGRGDNWDSRDRGDPYKANPLNTYAPQFGGRWNTKFPGAGGTNMNSDSDLTKSPSNHDMDDEQKVQKARDLLDETQEGMGVAKYVVRVPIKEGDDPEALAEQLFGSEGKADRGSVFVIVPSFEEAMQVQKRVPGAVCEPMNKGGKQ